MSCLFINILPITFNIFIKPKVELSKVEQWNTDWKNESEKENELKKLEWDMKMAIYEMCGVDLPDISIELEVSD